MEYSGVSAVKVETFGKKWKVKFLMMLGAAVCLGNTQKPGLSVFLIYWVQY